MQLGFLRLERPPEMCIRDSFQAVYDKFLQYKHSSLIAWDRVHPNQIGATLMAKEWLSKCGFEYDHTPEA